MKNLKGKLLLLLLIIIVAAAAFYSFQPSPEPTLALTRIYGLNLQPGDTVEINITISDVSDLAYSRVNLAWDPYVLKVTTGDPNGWMDPITRINYSVYEGPFMKSFSNSSMFLLNEVNNVAGTIWALSNYFAETGKSASGSGVLAIINFTCINPGTTTIEITGPREGHASLPMGSNPNEQIPHKEVYGLITEMGPPPMWTEFWFQISVIIVEIIVLALVSLVIVIKRRPKPMKPMRKPAAEEEIEI